MINDIGYLACVRVSREAFKESAIAHQNDLYCNSGYLLEWKVNHNGFRFVD